LDQKILAIKVITLNPEIFPGPLLASVTGRALKKNIWTLATIDLRAFGQGKHKKVDDRPVAGGPGMVIKPDVLDMALKHSLGSTKNEAKKTILYMSPKGKRFNQNYAKSLTLFDEIVIICGRFEGIDERVLRKYTIEEVSMGDYILSGGELAAMALLDSVVRLLPGTLGNPSSIIAESFQDGLLEAPNFTRPILWEGLKVPDILLSGDHQKIYQWKKEASEKETKEKRPDLYIKYIEKKKK
jgi:tRNA (guanine37-N1)-methyltransferase